MRLFLSCILFLLFFSCTGENPDRSFEQENDNSFESENINVQLSKVSESTFQAQIIANGTVAAVEKSELRFRTSNVISDIKFLNGQRVNKEDLIATLENSILKNLLDKAQIELQKAERKFDEEKINFGESSLSEKVRVQLEVKSGLLEARNNLERAQIEYDQTILKAPFTGLIANIEKKQGDYITPADVFCTLINPNNLEVSFSVLQNDFDFISKGQKVEVQSFTNKSQSVQGTITEINPLVDENGLIKIKATLLSKNENLLDGMYVKVLINKPLQGVIVIPKEALVLRSNREVVFTYEKGRAKWNYVELVGENSTSYAIKEGLQSTDTLIVSGNLNLAHDANVNATFVSDEKPKK